MKVISDELQLQLIYLIQKAFEYEGDVFGRDHNDATDALSELKAAKQAQLERAPLSLQEIADAWGLKPENIPVSDIEAVREIEAAHGIGTEK